MGEDIEIFGQRRQKLFTPKMSHLRHGTGIMVEAIRKARLNVRILDSNYLEVLLLTGNQCP
ncbi:hypothetical protein Avbf_15221 [Armadillidium vulgare]|nr:hypothetical protein Avbf_15221 [Armadillidium vulgare]